MARRGLPAAVGWGAGLVALVAFLAALEWTFLDEAREGEREAAFRVDAVRTYAEATLARAVEDAWRRADARLEAVTADPLLDPTGLVLVEDEVVLVPASGSSAPGSALRTAYEGLDAKTPSPPRGVSPSPPTPSAPTPPRARNSVRGAAAPPAPTLDASADPTDEDPVIERRQLLLAVSRALDEGKALRIESSVRTFLAHRARYRLGPADDLPATAHLVHDLLTRTHPSDALLRMLLRDGFAGPTPVEGLQRQALRSWPRLSSDDRRWACDTVQELSRRAAVPHDDFSARCRERLAATEIAPPTADLSSGRWVLRRDGVAWSLIASGGSVRGGVLPRDASVEALTESLRRQGLLEAGARLSLSTNAERTPWAALTLDVFSPREQEAAAARARAFRLKTALLVVAFALGVGLVAIAAASQRRQRRLVEMKSDFVSTVSHELRTPLASMRVMAETLERKLAGQDAAKDYPARLVREVDGLTALVENILSFNRLDKGRWTPRLAPTSLAALVPVLEDAASSYGQAKVELTCEGFDLPLTADAELLQLLFVNLVRNACRYNAKDPVRLRLVARVEGDVAVITVQDNGVGIPEDARERVFEPFERLRDGGGRGGGGSGLGLPLCRRIAQLHGGDVRLSASSPEGSTFEVTLQRGAVRSAE